MWAGFAHELASIYFVAVTDSMLEAAARAVVVQLANAMGHVAPPLRVSREVANAAANATEIVINPAWLHSAMTAVCSDPLCRFALAVGIIAHELSHVVHGDAFAHPMSKRFIELQADAFAGVLTAA